MATKVALVCIDSRVTSAITVPVGVNVISMLFRDPQTWSICENW